MIKFKYCIELKEGYAPITVDSVGEENDLDFYIIAPNRATADRMVKAMLEGATNIAYITGVSLPGYMED